MKIKSFLAMSAMLLSLAAIGSARTWSVIIDSHTKVGSVSIPAGSYTVKVDKDQVFFVNDSGKKYAVPAKIANAPDKKYDETKLRTEKQGEMNIIHGIDLGGTNEEVQFGE
jgi:hypothetical protein